MPEHGLVRQVLLNCARPTHETLVAGVPNLSIENATKLSKDRKLWSKNRPSLRCQPLSGGVAIKKVSIGVHFGVCKVLIVAFQNLDRRCVNALSNSLVVFTL